ncbi:Protein FAR1-RELATED SEQUENCE 5 [Abeliophyllum distichum]|uniref:Protein FAR1-RELATED SEQUENCE n=1 Tax=Abeliophyllum distichum TaxID=126358 RepID=A0ABD1RGU4_9LAMI
MKFESGDNVYVPPVTISVIFHVGQEFKSSDDVYNFYNQYEGKTNETYQMSRKDAVPRTGERNRRQVRCGCNARLSVVKQQTGKGWVVSKFVEEHNHPLATPSRSYAYFGDVVVFDTTYNTNRYSMVFGPFVGVNHHGRTVIFGYGLLSDETTKSFVWLFTKFIEAMPNHAALEVIITNQDAAIVRAISIVLPSTLHRFCIWHILNKFLEKMNVVLYNDQYHMLVHIIKQSESLAEFKQQWIEVMETTELDFVARFNRALVHQRHEELAANHIDLTQTSKVTTTLMMENQMVQIYKKKIFLLFQNKLVQSNSYICSKRSSSDDAKVHVVQHFEPSRTSDRTRQVNYFLSTDYISCSCQMFNFEGYPCQHMLCHMKKKVMLLLEKYILLKWTKNAKQARVFDLTTGSYVHTDPGHSLMSRHNMLSYAASDLVNERSLTDARRTFLLSEFQSLCIRVKDIDTDGDAGMSKNRNKRI